MRVRGRRERSLPHDQLAVHGAARIIVDKGIDADAMREKGIDADLVVRSTMHMLRLAMQP